MKFSEWYQIREEKDACYHKVKSRYRVFPSAYACVPVKTSKALTKEGWCNYQDLKIGDEILTFSLEKEQLEFKPILNLYYYDNAETCVVKNGNTAWKFECTPNHKWVIKHPKCEGTRGRKKYIDIINDMRLASIEELLSGSGSNRKLVISSKYYGGKPISLDKIYKYQTNWIEYLLNCSPEQRESWLYSAIVYDGNQIKTQRLVGQKNESNHEYLYDTPRGKQSFGFKQKDINHRDAFLLSAFLNKGLVTFKKVNNRDVYNCYYIAFNGTKSFENFKIIEKRNSNVWCPQTENGTWVMMQETDGSGLITITGNSGALVKCRKVGASNWGNKTKKMQKEQTEVNEALKDRKQYDNAMQAIMALHYAGVDAETASREEIKNALEKMGKNSPEDVGMDLFVSRIKSVAKGGTEAGDFSEGTFDLEKKRGLRGWFDRNRGKGWIDCKASKKGHLVPCGRKTAGEGAERKYPACRPTLSACNKKGTRRKKSSKPISWE